MNEDKDKVKLQEWFMIACIIFVLYSCPDVDFNTPKQMASVLSSYFNKFVVKL